MTCMLAIIQWRGAAAGEERGSMEVEQVLHMKEGTGKASYANNSKFQERATAMVKKILEESIQELYSGEQPEHLMLADLGCSSGPNALTMLAEIIAMVDNTCQSLNLKLPEFQVFLNDLPGNDFNTMFKSLPNLWKKLKKLKERDSEVACFISATPGSFYKRLFPRNCLHLIYSVYAVHWLSQVPRGLEGEDGLALNKGNLNIGKACQPQVHKAYHDQFEKDFTLFLSLRSQELVLGGRMVLTMPGNVDSKEPSTLWMLFSMALNDMVLQGLIEKEKVDAYNLPLYRASPGEVKKLIEDEGSFTLHQLSTVNLKWENQKLLADGMRAVLEPLLAAAFGVAVMDELFHRYEETARDYMATEQVETVNLVISMSRKS
ncbi:hypothetical protein Ancab_040591 [Ancistrocladus abbreviatus]